MRSWTPHGRAPEELTTQAAQAIAREPPITTRLLASVSRIDLLSVRNLADRCALENIDAVAVHGFPPKSTRSTVSGPSISDWPSITATHRETRRLSRRSRQR
jgi:hypothetical protein